MSFTGRIRLYLLLTALIPPLVVLLATWFSLSKGAEDDNLRNARKEIERMTLLINRFDNSVASSLESVSKSSQLEKAILLLRRQKTLRELDQLNLSELDFIEILSRGGVVLASAHRPGLVGRELPVRIQHTADKVSLTQTVEYDSQGRHAATSGFFPLSDSLYLYGGRFIDSSYLTLWESLIGSEISLLFYDDSSFTKTPFAGMKRFELYRQHNRLQAIIREPQEEGYVIYATFTEPVSLPLLSSLMGVILLATSLAVGGAILLGMLVARRTNREVSNLVQATSRVASGDFDTPVMAYEEGEFSQLADAFSEMMYRLKRIQSELRASETIAAWQTIGRKLAHEVKNPLTPISISADDLRRSYEEGQPDFDQILIRNCKMIKQEVSRLSHMLDQFVNFARMPAPVMALTRSDNLTGEIATLYAQEIADNRLIIRNSEKNCLLNIDREQIKQLLINLVKNAQESEPNTTVTITTEVTNNMFMFRVEDSGPGFTDEQIKKGVQPSLSSKAEGSGLGLVICQRIVKDHNGTLEIANRSEGGASVTVCLPISNG